MGLGEASGRNTVIMFVGLISDTHGIFSDEFKDFFGPVDVIWHAGDFGVDILLLDWSGLVLWPLESDYYQ